MTITYILDKILSMREILNFDDLFHIKSPDTIQKEIAAIALGNEKDFDGLFDKKKYSSIQEVIDEWDK